MPNGETGLKQLESLKYEFGQRAAELKQGCLQLLESGCLKNGSQVARLHEVLCFMQAWPDDEVIRSAVDAMLDQFSDRRDLKRHAEELANSGIAGTPISFRFYASTARWLVDRWPGHLQIDWDEVENGEALAPYLNLLASYSETPALDATELPLRQWIDRLKGPEETDAAFVIRRLSAVLSDEFLHDQIYDAIDIPLTVSPGTGVPSRTCARRERSPVDYQTTPLIRKRPAVDVEIGRPLGPTRLVSRAEGRRLVDLARSAMVTRLRDLDAFAYADPNDVTILDDGSLQFVIYGVAPPRRFLLETLSGYLILKNGVPISYGAATCLFNSAEIAYTIFDTFRGGESAHIFARTLAVYHQAFGCDTFVIDPYQLGAENDDALKSGAWWFYQKLGFRPREKALQKLMNRELAIMKRKPRHRSSLSVLRRLVSDFLFLTLDEDRDDVMGRLDFANLGLRITDLLGSRFGSGREQGERILAAEAADRLGVRSFRSWSSAERLAWGRWSPLVALLDNLDQWPAADRKDLVKLIRAKGGRQEVEYLRLFNRHGRLRKALVALSNS